MIMIRLSKKELTRTFLLIITVLMIPCLHDVQGATTKKKSDEVVKQEFEANWTKTEKAIHEENKQFKKLSKESLQAVKQERNRLLKTKRDLTGKIDKQEAELEKHRTLFNKLLQLEEQLLTEIEAENQELKTLEGTIRASAKEADGLIRGNPTSYEVKERTKLVSTLLEPDHYPSLDEIVGLSNLYFNEVELSSQVKTRTGEFIDKSGNIVTGEILRAGTFTTYYQSVDSGERGFLKPDNQSLYLTAIPQEITGKTETALENYLEGQEISLPVDLSRGAIFQLMTKEKGLSETIQAGGVLAWMILLIGAIALVIALERIYNLIRIRSASEKEFSGLMELVESNELGKSLDYCDNYRKKPTFRVLKSILSFAKSESTVIENACEESIMREMPRLERFLSTLGVLAAIAPLLGLLGTVTGMINTFQVISAFGTGDPKMMSGGISEALITTQLGLAVAIPIMLFHHYLERRVDRIMGNMEEKGSALTVSLMETYGKSDQSRNVDYAN